jgi:uncharacterized protein YbdZ (MbtH family)
MNKNNILTPLLVLGIAIGGVLPAKEALSETTNICKTSPIPAGWVVTSISTSYSTCGYTNNNVLTIVNTNILSPGSSLATCNTYSLPPTGWVVTYVDSSYSKCGSNYYNNNVSTINRANGLPINSSLSICNSYSLPPTGWAVTSNSTTYTQCGTNYYNNNLSKIKRVS